jgi:hypothetical protein
MDYSFGIKCENQVIQVLKETYPDILKTAQNHPFDFITGNTFFELKSRRNNHNTYPDTMIGYNKIQYAKMNPDKNYVFLFKFLDGLYKHDFDPQKTYSVRQGGRIDRGAPEIKDYVFIPVKELSLVNP